MLSLKDLMLDEVKKGLERAGVKANLDFIGNHIIITITKNELTNIIMSGFPDQFKSAVEVEASEIKIKIKVL